jgi:hypothetical protein
MTDLSLKQQHKAGENKSKAIDINIGNRIINWGDIVNAFKSEYNSNPLSHQTLLLAFYVLTSVRRLEYRKCRIYETIEDFDKATDKNKILITREKSFISLSEYKTFKDYGTFEATYDENHTCYDCAWLSLTALSTVTCNLWL